MHRDNSRAEPEADHSACKDHSTTHGCISQRRPADEPHSGHVVFMINSLSGSDVNVFKRGTSVPTHGKACSRSLETNVEHAAARFIELSNT